MPRRTEVGPPFSKLSMFYEDGVGPPFSNEMGLDPPIFCRKWGGGVQPHPPTQTLIDGDDKDDDGADGDRHDDSSAFK